jgi:DNA-binding LytR/AlgR family response regulator
MHATALIAEDEPLLATALQQELGRLWPELNLLPHASDGHEALRRVLAEQPDLCFLDIRMPGLSGLEVAQALAEDWPDEGDAPDGADFPLIVFVTAYDQYAVRAFEAAAVDYVLKPVESDRMARTCERLRVLLSRQREARQGSTRLQAALEVLRTLGTTVMRSPSVPAPRLTMIPAGAGHTVEMVPVSQVLYFEAADKYVRVQTAGKEYLVRTALRELLPQLDPGQFWQIHRGTVVRADAIERVVRDPDSGKLRVHLRGRAETLLVSRLHAPRFKAW